MKQWILALLLSATTLCHAVAIRNTATTVFNAASVTVAWPSGTVAGDAAYIAVGQGCGATVPSGWNSLITNNVSGTSQSYGTATFNGIVINKVLTAADITATSVTITTGCGFNGVAIIATLVGSASGISSFDPAEGASSPVTITPATVPQANSLALYFALNRSAGTAPTVSRGVLQHAAADASAACGSLYAESLASAGSISPVFTFPTSANQFSFVLVLSSGSAPAVGLAQ